MGAQEVVRKQVWLRIKHETYRTTSHHSTMSVCVCVCVCDFFFFFLLSLFVTLYIFLHLTAMYSSSFGKGWVGRSCLYFLVQVSFGSFSLQELTCMHCVHLAL